MKRFLSIILSFVAGASMLAFSACAVNGGGDPSADNEQTGNNEDNGGQNTPSDPQTPQIPAGGYKTFSARRASRVVGRRKKRHRIRIFFYAIQFLGDFGAWVSGVQYDNNCQNLNIWAPESAQNAPVMVWLYGFGLGTGTVAEGWFNLAVDFWEKNR